MCKLSYVPSLCNALSCGFIHIYSFDWDMTLVTLRWSDKGVIFEMSTTTYHQEKPPPPIALFFFFFSSSLKVVSLIGMLFSVAGVDWGPVWGGTSLCSETFVSRCWKVYFAATAIFLSPWLHGQVLWASSPIVEILAILHQLGEQQVSCNIITLGC